MYKLGSLFDGSGGFPLAGALCGIEPSWASEVEPYPIAVTRERFPNMKHLGDISKINGAEVEPVDIITFGSPCQDLSVAGKRAGLKHEANGDEETTRSGLFMEAVRIIKEMRRATNGKYPSFALWENVPGAFSSNKGEDFRVVCEELIKIVEPSAFMPPVPKNGWPYADSYVGDGWSLAYRVFDAQYWGVPQRRRRIHLILDLRGERAREVLFERESVRGYFTQGGKAREGTPANAEGSTGANDREGKTAGAYGVTTKGNGDAFISKERHTALTLGGGQAGQGYPCVMEAVGFDSYNLCETGDIGRPYTLKIRSGCEGGGKGALIQKDKSATLATNNDQYLFQPVAYDARGNGSGKVANTITGDHENRITDYSSVVVEEKPVYCLQGSMIGRADKNDPQGDGVNENVTFTCNTIDRHAVAYIDTTHADDVVRVDDVTAPLQARDYKGGKLVQVQYIVRRLTPTECARLQGFADCWGYIEPKDTLHDEEYRFWQEVRNTHAAINDKPVKEYTVKQMLTWYNKLYTDSAEYKMWGNGIALPPALYCMQGITDALNAYANAGEGDGITLPEEIEQKFTEIENLMQEAKKEDELTDLSETPEEIKEEIMENAEKLEEMTAAEETPAEITETTKEATTTDFNAVEQLKALAEERKLLALINTNTPRFDYDVRAIEYAVSVLEAVGL